MTLTEQNLGLCTFFAKRFAKCYGLEFADLRSEATLAMVQAEKTYNETKSPFKNWASFKIRGSLSRYVARERAARCLPLTDKMLLALLQTEPVCDKSEFITDLVEKLPASIQVIVKRRFGFMVGGTETLKEIGSDLGLSRRAVREKLQEGLSLLRKYIEQEQE